MVIKYVGPGDLFDAEEQTLVCPTNVAGAMGKGLALEFKTRYPEVFHFYRQQFPFDPTPTFAKTHRLLTLPLGNQKQQQVLLFPTKLHWRDPSPWEVIWTNLSILASEWQQLHIRSIALPPLGCGNGGWKFEEVLPAIQHWLEPIPVPVSIYTGASS